MEDFTRINEIIQHLQATTSLHDRWKNVQQFRIDCPVLTKEDVEALSNERDTYQRFVKLKELIFLRARGNYLNQNLNYWLIKAWGGIGSFQEKDLNIQRFQTFCDQLTKEKLTRGCFSVISSLSKVSSFVNPVKYVIYDSRAVSSLNWLLLTTSSDSLRLFPVPQGRSKIAKGYDMLTIVNLIKNSNSKEISFYHYSEAYFEFCKLVKRIANNINGGAYRMYIKATGEEHAEIMKKIWDKKIGGEKIKSRKKSGSI